LVLNRHVTVGKIRVGVHEIVVETS
jgi:hypothetical protein